MFQRVVVGFFIIFMALTAQGVAADATGKYSLVIRDHRFIPEELKVPAGVKVLIEVDNQDNTPEEFEAESLGREKVIPAGKKGIISLSPLKPGKYEFFGEFHKTTAKGVIVAE